MPDILVGDFVSRVEEAVKKGNATAFEKLDALSKEVAQNREDQRALSAKLNDVGSFNAAKEKQFSVARYLNGRVREKTAGIVNPWAGLEFERDAMQALREAKQKALSLSNDTAVGFLAPTSMAAVVDILRSKEIITKLGVTTIQANVGRIEIPRVTADPTVTETGENTAITDSDGTVDMISMTPHKIAGLCKLSKTLVRCGAGAEAFVQRALIAQYLRRKQIRFYAGTGAGQQVRGIGNTTGRNSVAFSAAPTLSKLYDMLKEIESDNADTDVASLAWNFHPRAKYAIAQITVGASSLGYPILTQGDVSRGLQPTLLGIPYHTTTDIAVAGGTSTSIWLGVWSEVVVAEWGPPETDLSDVAGTSWESDQIWAKIVGEYDMCVPHPEALCEGTAVTVS